MLSNWAIQWLVKFNHFKLKQFYFTLKYLEAFPQLIFDNTPIKVVSGHNFQPQRPVAHTYRTYCKYSVENIRHNAQTQIHSEQKCIK